MEAGKARKRPVINDFVEMTDDNGADVAKWCNGEWNADAGVVLVPTLEGQVPATADGSRYVIQGTHGEFYPIKPPVFDAVYDTEVGGPGMRLHRDGHADRHAAVCDCGARFHSVSIRTAAFQWALHAIEAHRGEL